MSSSSSSTFVPKPVQEQLSNGEEFSERYIYKGQDRETVGAHFPVADIQVVDLRKFSSLSPERDEEFKKLKSALNSWGCFQAVNHGMSISLMEQTREATKSFFATAKEEKQKYARPEDDIEGYGNDMILSEKQTLDWTDRLYLTIMPIGQRKLQYWPQTPPNFRDVLDEFAKASERIGEEVFKAMAVSLGLDEHCFLEMYGKEPKMYARFNFYPPCPRPDLVLGVKPHADGSALTILLQDKDVEGLQVKKNGQWFQVATIPDALLINVGDQMEIMSNGYFWSPVHRVSTNASKERISVAVFCIPDGESEIEPAGELMDEDRPRLYKTVKNYVDLYFQNYQIGRRPIDAAKI
uniref:Fe2OG dioxygenase domain-containing protein n=1 Tax=Kalanchoe fedtschenkoi TaxID=63787 RepID=A0A7N0U109_KALFE